MTSDTSKDIIIAEHVSKWFDDFQALNDISTTVKEQEVVVVFGPPDPASRPSSAPSTASRPTTRAAS